MPKTKADIPTPADVAAQLARNLGKQGFHLSGPTKAEARERMIVFMTANWERHLIALGMRLLEQGFSQDEVLQLAENTRPKFEESMVDALLQFDRDWEEATAYFRAVDAIRDAAKKPEADA